MANISAAQILEIVLGLFVVVCILFDVFVSVIVPRPVRSRWRISAYVNRYGWPQWRALVRNFVSVERRDQFLGAFAPMSVMFTLIVWETGLLLGYALLFFGARSEMHPPLRDFGEAIYFTGTTLLTIGYGDFVPSGGFTRFLAMATATSGLATLAIVLTFLFSIFASFQRRELFVLSVDARGPAPASGVAVLERLAQLDVVSDLPRIFVQGQTWAAEVLDNHLAYPILAYFRSSHVDVSWLAALGAVLDAATLVISTLEEVPKGQAYIMHDIGSHLTHDLAKYFRFTSDGEVRVELFEYQNARQRLAAAGYKLVEERKGWSEFQNLRAQYAGDLNSMARYWDIPPAQWIGDRSSIAARH